MSDVKVIEKLYEMIYPYGKYNNDPVTTCYAINQELKKLCELDMRHVLIILLKSLNTKITITPNTPTVNICHHIQEHIYNLCLRLPNIEKAKLVLAFKGALGILESDVLTEREICQEVSNINRSDYVIGNNRLILGGLGGLLKDWSDIIQNEMSIKWGGSNADKNMKTRYLEMFRKGYDTLDKKTLTPEHIISQKPETIRPYHAKFYLKTLKQIYNGEIPAHIKWSDLCMV